MHPKLAQLIGTSPSFVRVLERVPLVAGCDVGVLILGETGTGKELIAQGVHYLGARAGQPFVAVNCGALPMELVESELFGHVRGAFTSAHDAQRGLVAQARGGTLFLDEVDSLPLVAQVKLLRFLQDKEFRPLGAARCEQADVRIIAASNLDLWNQVQGGRFRADLYYRLNVLTLALPSLRERPEDLLPLARHFCQRYARLLLRPVQGLSACACAAIEGHGWPGNVRELEHAVERGVLLAAGELVTAEDLGLPGTAGEEADPVESFQDAKARVVQQFESRYIEQLLQRHGGNVTRAAEACAKNRRAFFALMKKHHIDSRRFRQAG
jgi:DNA-binding NtrC family response regulator